MRTARFAGRLTLALAFGCGVFASSEQKAHAFDFGTEERQHPFRSAQNFEIELRFSPYFPQVDKEPGLQGTPFKDSFGTNPRLYFGLEFDWQVYRIPHVGTIGPGFSAGLVGMSRPAVTKEAVPRPSGDTFSLDIYPMYLAAVFRADAFWYDHGFPIVPYAKAGFGYALWRASNSLGTSNTNGVSGKGLSYGSFFAVGAAFALDSLDVGASRNMDNAVGVNNSYVYFEYYWLTLNDFGGGSPLFVGTNTWTLGLAFEF